MTCARAGHPVLGGMRSPAGYELIIDAGPVIALMKTLDAGAPDAGADAGTDAGSDAGRADAGAVDANAVDASAMSDAGEGIDAGTIGGMTGGSCGCRVAGGTNNSRAMTILATLALGLVARRRRAR